ncbi:hypothetical protein ACFCVO_19805, partial [Agromyces sp. NPDC056379]|uniref:hypothetical protein n=1 Tax=Agromyces sp. NPDC056379 TaxID=3345802 RepID=UPI0035D93706
CEIVGGSAGHGGILSASSNLTAGERMGSPCSAHSFITAAAVSVHPSGHERSRPTDEGVNHGEERS